LDFETVSLLDLDDIIGLDLDLKNFSQFFISAILYVSVNASPVICLAKSFHKAKF